MFMSPIVGAIAVMFACVLSIIVVTKLVKLTFKLAFWVIKQICAIIFFPFRLLFSAVFGLLH